MQGPDLPNHVNANGEQIAIATSSMIRSHSVSGDLHGVQPDPIAADILRKEPEQETFARLKITPTGMNFSYFLSMYSFSVVSFFFKYICTELCTCRRVSYGPHCVLLNTACCC